MGFEALKIGVPLVTGFLDMLGGFYGAGERKRVAEEYGEATQGIPQQLVNTAENTNRNLGTITTDLGKSTWGRVEDLRKNNPLWGRENTRFETHGFGPGSPLKMPTGGGGDGPGGAFGIASDYSRSAMAAAGQGAAETREFVDTALDDLRSGYERAERTLTDWLPRRMENQANQLREAKDNKARERQQLVQSGQITANDALKMDRQDDEKYRETLATFGGRMAVQFAQAQSGLVERGARALGNAGIKAGQLIGSSFFQMAGTALSAGKLTVDALNADADAAYREEVLFQQGKRDEADRRRAEEVGAGLAITNAIMEGGNIAGKQALLEIGAGDAMAQAWSQFSGITQNVRNFWGSTI